MTFSLRRLHPACDPFVLILTCSGMTACIQSWLRLLWVGMRQWWGGVSSRKITDRRLYPHGSVVRQSKKNTLFWNGPQVPRNPTDSS